ncbi:MAG: hypothetical protein WC878_02170 [Candidatus Paceibacterota bacterium]|jgi:pyruvate ferredoxin oxidoreductase alpha subunit
MNNSKYAVVQPGDGNLMAAMATVHANTGVVAGFQITPSTQFFEHICEWKRTGFFKGVVRTMNGEDDAFTASWQASKCGVRTANSSCSQGLLYASQPIMCLSGDRCPVVIFVANRAISVPVNIHADHSDIMPFRDSGGIMFFAKNAQEVYDLGLLSFKIGEDPRVQTWVGNNYDGFEISHTTSINKILNEAGVEKIRDYIGLHYKRPHSMLDMEHPTSSGALVLPNYQMEMKYAVMQAMLNSNEVITEATNFWSENFWPVHSFIEAYELEDAEYAVVVMGSRFGTVKEAVKIARRAGKKVGALRIVCFRPFPVEKVRESLFGKKAVAVLDRMGAYGSPMAPLCESVVGSLINDDRMPRVRGFVDSLGGRILAVEQVLEIIQSLEHPEKWNKAIRPTWVGVRGGDTI